MANPTNVNPPGPSLSYGQLEQLWISAGGDPNLADTMAAIAEAESHGHEFALNNNPGTGDYSVGPWQINYFDGLNAPRTARYGSAEYVRTHPEADAKAAVDLARGGQGLSNWSTYSSGAYRQYLGGRNVGGGGGNVLGNVITGTINGIVPGAGSAINSITGAITGSGGILSGWQSGVQAFFYQGFFILVGLGLMLVGLFLVARSLMQVGAPAVIGEIERGVRIRQAGGRLQEQRLAGQRAERRLQIQERQASNTVTMEDGRQIQIVG